jgi:predicted AAA+ superfamily ATPase
MSYEAKLYNPAAQPEDWLIEHFVVRTKVFGRIFEDVKTSTMQHPEQHYLIQGQRGMGKTTLLLRLKYEIERTEQIKDWLVPVFFNEESYDLNSLSNLWEKLLKYFDEYFNDGGNYYDATEKYVGSKDYEQKCFELVTDILKQHKKKIVILFDNFAFVDRYFFHDYCLF